MRGKWWAPAGFAAAALVLAACGSSSSGSTGSASSSAPSAASSAASGTTLKMTTFNGKKVHDNAEIYAWTGGALDNKEDQPGPIMIQGDHSLVTVKKLVVTPITKAGM